VLKPFADQIGLVYDKKTKKHTPSRLYLLDDMERYSLACSLVVFMGSDFLNFSPSLPRPWLELMTIIIFVTTLVWILSFVRNLLIARRDWVHTQASTRT
jgi:hypothetical protein